MKILIINTANDYSFISLVNDNKVQTKVFSTIQRTSEDLLPEIDRILKHNKLSLSKLDSVAICIGPGSFTGIRVGLATVKAFKIGANIPVITFNIFECFGNWTKRYLIKANSGGAYFYTRGNITFLTKEELRDMNVKNVSIFQQECNYFNFVDAVQTDIVTSTISLCKNKFLKRQFRELNELNPIYVLKSQAENELNTNIINAKIKRLQLCDLTAICEIEKECFKKPYSKEIITNDLENKAKAYFGLFLKDEIIGYASFGIIGDEIELDRIAVIKRYRNLNLAYKLMQGAFKKLKMKKCFLEVNKKNRYAIKLYIKLGFVKMGERKNYYGVGEDAMTMQKVF